MSTAHRQPAVVPLPPPSRGAVRALQALGGVAIVSLLVGVAWRPDRTWPAALVAAQILTGLGVGGAVFLAFHYLTGARWSVPILRVAEAMTGALLPAGLAMLLLAFGLGTLYAWADPEQVHGDRILEARSVWMNVPGFLVRVVVCFAAWALLAAVLGRTSRRQDRDGSPVHRARNARWSGLFLVVFGITFTAASFDWLMSLERHWFSTIFGIYQFSGVFLSSVAALTILVVALRRRGVLAGVVTEDTLHDLGKLLFGFSLFWGYIWFCQYMLIWYVNSPEEIGYYLTRHQGAWAPLSAANVLLNWTIPFVLLLPRGMKRSETVLLRVSVLLLAGRWLDLWLAVVPAGSPTPVVSWWDFALPAGAVAAFLACWRRAFGKAPPVPRGEPLPAPAHS